MLFSKFSEKNFVEELDKKYEYDFLKKIEMYDDKVASSMRLAGYKRINQAERTVTFSFGEITFSRSRWRKGNQTRCPVDEWLGLKKYMRFSPELICCIAKQASMMSYRQVCKVIKECFRIEISKDTVLKAVKQAGELLSEKEKFRFWLEKEPSKKIKPKILYIEGDGVMVKSSDCARDEKKNIDLAHFLIHTGSKKVANNRYTLKNKHEIVHANYSKAKEELLDYLYNHYEFTNETILITNSDNGKGYTPKVFQEIKKALGIKRHEHFWDAYHLNEKIDTFFKKYPECLRKLAFNAIKSHQRELMKTVLDTVESLIVDENSEEYYNYLNFRFKILNNFKYTKPAKLRGLSPKGIGVMESQHRKITYRMKHRGMYWSLKGAYTMSRLIILERINCVDNLFFGNWRKEYQYYQNQRLSVGYLTGVKKETAIKSRKILQRAGKFLGYDRQLFKY
ncbi:DDE transposase [Streptococcus agalactiae]|uniref:ISLre2 family transposase n=1 Tax=Streptococcus agalactiae TaxID=1311 RepID=UPI000E049E2B|nr:ISLre2 family transposase [Streptococcus agalactiae]SUN07086.1 DDE transposase [Streptococcus agalactiae]